MIDLLAGNIQLIFATAASSIAHIKSKTVKWAKVIKAMGIKPN